MIYIYTYTRTHTFYVVRDRYPQSAAPSPRNSSTENADSDTEVTADSGSSSESEGHALHPSEPATWRVGWLKSPRNRRISCFTMHTMFHSLTKCLMWSCEVSDGKWLLNYCFRVFFAWWGLLIQHSPLKIT